MGSIRQHPSLAVALAALAAVFAAAPAEARRSPGPPTTSTTKPAPGYVPAGTPGATPTTVHVVFPDGPDHPGPVYPGPSFPRPDFAGPPIIELPRPVMGPPDVGGPPLPLPAGPVTPPRGPRALPEPEEARAPAPAPRRQLGDILTVTGADSLPLARTGLAVLALGAGMRMLARRRRATCRVAANPSP